MLEPSRLNEFVLDHMLQPLALGSFTNWLRLLRENQGIDPAFLGRAAFVSAVSLVTSPLRFYQRLKVRRMVEHITIRRPPIFILGHWRSGTTHLHNLLCQDPRLGYVSSFQVIAPDLFYAAGKTIRSILRRGMPETRLIDNMPWSIDGPQEEEMALGNVSPYSLYHHWSFPRNARHYFDRYVLFRGVPAEVISYWKQKYIQLIKMTTLNMLGRRLVIKNPANTGRIRILLQLFPQAKFIHLHRNPYRVFVSTRHLYRKTLEHSQLQAISRTEIESNVLNFYRKLMGQYLCDRALIPPQNLIEIGFDDLDRRPDWVLDQVYSRIRMRRSAQARVAARRYLESLKGYQKNRYQITAEDMEKVSRHWEFSFRTFGYPMGVAES